MKKPEEKAEKSLPASSGSRPDPSGRSPFLFFFPDPMTVEELIAELQRLPPHAEARLAMQPAWPFEYDIGHVTEAVPLPEGDTVYLVEGPQLGYLPGEAAEEIGW